jgi:hypothetical protein
VLGGLGAAIAYDLAGSYRMTFVLGVMGFVLAAGLIAVMPQPERLRLAVRETASSQTERLG